MPKFAMLTCEYCSIFALSRATTPTESIVELIVAKKTFTVKLKITRCEFTSFNVSNPFSIDMPVVTTSLCILIIICIDRETHIPDVLNIHMRRGLVTFYFDSNDKPSGYLTIHDEL
jgi:hypothetical protein